MNEIKKTQQKALSYRYRDGINEMVVGIALVLAGSLFVWAAKSGSNGMRYAAMFTLFASVPLGMLLIRYLKNQITFPRSGIVHYPKPRRSFKERLVMNYFVVIVVSATSHYWHDMQLWGQSLSDVVVAGFLVALAIHITVNAIRWRMPRLFVIVAAILSAAFLFLYANGNDLVEFALILVIPGIAAILTGGFAFVSYLKRYPKNAEETL